MKKSLLLAACLPGGFLLTVLLAGGFCRGDISYHVGQAMSDLETIKSAVRSLAECERFTAADWDEIDDMAAVAPRLAKYLDQGMNGLIDPWGERYIWEKRDEGDQIIITLPSGHVLRRRWSRVEKVIGYELIISRPDGAILRSQALWR